MNSKITSKLIKKKSTNNILWLDGIHRKKRKAKIVIMIKRCWVSMSLRTVWMAGAIFLKIISIHILAI